MTMMKTMGLPKGTFVMFSFYLNGGVLVCVVAHL